MKRVVSVLFVTLCTVSMMGCMGDPVVETSEEPLGMEDTGPLTIADCTEIGELVDAETGYSCLIGVAIESDDVSVCDQIPAENAQHTECKEAMGV